MRKSDSQTKLFQILVIVVLAAYFILALVAAYDKTRIAATIDTSKLTQMELLTLNGQKSFLVNAIDLIQPSLAWVAGILGVIWSILTFENERRKEKEQQILKEEEEKRLEEIHKQEEKRQEEIREQEEKQRQADREEDRLSAEVQLGIKDIWSGISSENESDRAGSIARLLFLIELVSSEHYKLDQTVKIQIASALAFAGRQKNSKQTIETLTPVVMKAFEKFDYDVISRVSWQGLHLITPDFSGKNPNQPRDLRKLNFRESILEDAKFVYCDLSDADFERARVNGSDFYSSVLKGTNFRYANLEGAFFIRSALDRADLRRALLKDVDFHSASLEYTKLSEFVEEWRQTKNWRETQKMKPNFKKLLDKEYGKGVVNGNIMLMIAWEFLPYVSGGGWTALYHLIYNLLREGWQIVLITPLPKEFIDFSAFGNLVEVISVFDKESAPLSIYSSIYFNAYSNMTAYQSGLIFEVEKQASIVSVSERFANNVAYWIEKVINEQFQNKDVPFKLIYSHDWLCARAAKAVKKAFLTSKNTSVPWFAHFHSLESDRQNENQRSKMIETIENEMAQEADFVIAPSLRTAAKIKTEYGREDVFALPNYFTDIEDLDYKVAKNTNLGEFDTKLVLFIGRIGWQKGPDIFVRLADKVLAQSYESGTPHFVMYGRGPMEREIGEMIYRYFPQKPYVFKPLKDYDPSSDYPPHLGKINPVLVEDSVDSFTLHILDRYGVLTEERARVVEKNLYERGFQAYRIQGEPPYTHLVRMTDLDDGWQTTYLVEGAWFPTPVYQRKRTVELMGNVDWTERFGVFRGATVVVVPSRNEPYGMVIVEAIKCGVPVLYTDEAGVAERFDEKIGACSVNDEDGLANQLKRLLYDYSEWETTLEKQKELYIKLQRDQHFDEFLDLIANQKAQSPDKGS